MMSLISRLPIPHRIAGFALTGTLFILILLGLAHHSFRGEIVELSPSVSASASSLRSQLSFAAVDNGADAAGLAPAGPPDVGARDAPAGPYYVFLQKFPLAASFRRLFHTEVVVCPRGTFRDAAFLDLLDGKLAALDGTAKKQPFVAIDEGHWSKQMEAGCVQLGYGGASCGLGCCGAPHKHENTNYALGSRAAVIGNALGDHKEMYLYGVSGSAAGGEDVGISGEDAYRSVCHGHMNAVEIGALPACVSDWTGKNYNPITNNCNTFTSTVLKCVYGLSDAKPHLGVSDLINVKCPTETSEDGKKVEKCLLPKMDALFEVGGEDALSLD